MAVDQFNDYLYTTLAYSMVRLQNHVKRGTVGIPKARK